MPIFRGRQQELIVLTWTSQNQTGEMLTLQDGTPYRNLQRENSLSTFMLR